MNYLTFNNQKIQNQTQLILILLQIFIGGDLLKLLIVCQYFYPEEFPINDICFDLVENGYDVTVLTGLPNYPQGEIYAGYSWEELEKIEKSGIKLHTTGLHYDNKLNAYIENIHGVKVIRINLRPKLKGKKNLAKNYLSFVKEGNNVASTMAKIYKNDIEKGYEKDSEYNFDKIIVFQYSPVTMSLPAITFKKESETNAPIYIYSFDLWPESIISLGLAKSGPIYLGIKLLSKHIYSQAEEIWISSHNFEKYFVQKLKIDKTLHYLPIYAEQIFLRKKVENKEPQNESESNDSNDDNDNNDNEISIDITTPQKRETNFLFAGSIDEIHSVETILNACNLVLKKGYNPLFHIVGDGSSYNNIIDLAASLDLTNKNIIFYGERNLKEMSHFYETADAFLVTLKKDEFISYTLPEQVQSYLAYGKPIVAAIDGEASRVITEARCGFIGPAENYEALARNIIRFIELTPSEREEYSTSSRNYYEEHFSQEIFFKNLDKLLNSN